MRGTPLPASTPLERRSSPCPNGSPSSGVLRLDTNGAIPSESGSANPPSPTADGGYPLRGVSDLPDPAFHAYRQQGPSADYRGDVGAIGGHFASNVSIERLRRLNHVPKKRVATKPTAGSRKRRLETKKQVGAKKAARGRVREWASARQQPCVRRHGTQPVRVLDEVVGHPQQLVSVARHNHGRGGIEAKLDEEWW